MKTQPQFFTHTCFPPDDRTFSFHSHPNSLEMSPAIVLNPPENKSAVSFPPLSCRLLSGLLDFPSEAEVLCPTPPHRPPLYGPSPPRVQSIPRIETCAPSGLLWPVTESLSRCQHSKLLDVRKWPE